MHREDGWTNRCGISMYQGAGPVGLTVIALWSCLTLAACGTPVHVSRVSAETVNHELTAYALSVGEPSGVTRIVLSRYNLLEEYDHSPETALARLHQAFVGPEGNRHMAFALAELSFLHAKDTGKRAYYLASALYAYAFLFPDDEAETPSAFDRRFRQACDLYNRALTEGFKSADGVEVEVHGGSYELPCGRLEMEFREEQLHWAGRLLEHFVPVAELQVEGLRIRYRIPGIDAPLSAAQKPAIEQQGLLVARRLKVPATIVLLASDLKHQLAQGNILASLELHVTFDWRSVRIGEREIRSKSKVRHLWLIRSRNRPSGRGSSRGSLWETLRPELRLRNWLRWNPIAPDVFQWCSCMEPPQVQAVGRT